MILKIYTTCSCLFFPLIQTSNSYEVRKSNNLSTVPYRSVDILTTRSVDIVAFTLVSWRVPSTLLIGLCRYCLGGNGGGELVRGDSTNTGDVRLRFRDGNGGATSLFVTWLNEEQSDTGVDVWVPNRVGRVERGGGGGGVGVSWKQNKHKNYTLVFI